MGELKRIYNYKTIIIFIAFLMLNCILFINEQNSGRNTLASRKQIELYNCLLDEYNEYKDELPITSKYKQLKRDGVNNDEADVYEKVLNKIIYINEYEKNIQQIVKNAKNMNRYSIFAKKNSFSYNNIKKTEKDFTYIKVHNMVVDNDIATEALTDYNLTIYISLIFVFVIMCNMLKERVNNISKLTWTMKNGRFKIAFIRQCILFITVLTTVSLMHIAVCLCSFCIYGGIDSINSPIQTIQEFSTYIYPVSRIQYLFIMLFNSIIVVYTVASIIWMLMVLIYNLKLFYVIAAMVAGIEFILYKNISGVSNLKILHDFNLFSLLSYNILSRKYYNIGFSKVVISCWNVVFILCCVISLIMSLITLIFYSRKINILNDNGKIYYKLIQIIQKNITSLPFCGKEFYKLLTGGNGILFLILIIVCSSYVCSTDRLNYSEIQLKNDELYYRYGGLDYSELKTKCEEIENEYIKAQQTYKKVLEDENETSENIVMAYADYEQKKNKLSSISEIIDKISYVENTKNDKSINCYLMSDRGYEKVFGIKSLRREMTNIIIFSIIIVLIISENFSKEYKSNMYMIMHTYRNGRKWSYIRKSLTNVLMTVLFYFIFRIIDIFYLMKYYDFNYIKAPVQSLSYMSDENMKISIIGYIILYYIVILAFEVLLVALAQLCMIIVKEKNNRFILCALISLTVFLTFIFIKNINYYILTLLCINLVLISLINYISMNIWSTAYGKRK